MMTWRRGDKQLVLDRVLFNFVPDEIKSVTDWKLNLSELTIIIYTFLDLNIEFVKNIFYLKTQRLQSCHLMPHLVSGLTRTSSHKTLACLNSSINISLNIFNSTWHLSNWWDTVLWIRIEIENKYGYNFNIKACGLIKSLINKSTTIS